MSQILRNANFIFSGSQAPRGNLFLETGAFETAFPRGVWERENHALSVWGEARREIKKEHKPNATRSAMSFICQRFAPEPKRGGLRFRYRVFQNLCFSDTLNGWRGTRGYGIRRTIVAVFLVSSILYPRTHDRIYDRALFRVADSR